MEKSPACRVLEICQRLEDKMIAERWLHVAALETATLCLMIMLVAFMLEPLWKWSVLVSLPVQLPIGFRLGRLSVRYHTVREQLGLLEEIRKLEVDKAYLDERELFGPPPDQPWMN